MRLTSAAVVAILAGGGVVALGFETDFGTYVRDELFRSGSQPETSADTPLQNAALNEEDPAEGAPSTTDFALAETGAAPPAEGEVQVAEGEVQVEELRAAIAEREAELKGLSAALAEGDARIEALTAQVALREADLAALRGELATLREELAALRDDAGATAKLAALKAPQVERDDQFDVLRSDAQRFYEELAAAKSETPAPAPAPAGAPLQSGPLTEVHFEMASARLTPGAQIRARAAAEALTKMQFEKVRITGHTDRTGDPGVNRALSRARAEAVADVLVEAGLSRQLIEITGFGETLDKLPISTGDGVAEPLNRCVGIWAVVAPEAQASN